MRYPTFVLSVLFSALSPIPAMAQNRLSTASDFSKPGQPVSQECMKEASEFAKLVSIYPHPSSGWNFVIVCDEGSWKHLMQRTALDQEPGEHYGETDIDKGITLIRGYKLLYPDMGASSDHVVAHELAHIMLRSRDEQKVDKQASLWLAERAATNTALLFPAKSTTR